MVKLGVPMDCLASFRRPTPYDHRAPVMVKLGVPMDWPGNIVCPHGLPPRSAFVCPHGLPHGLPGRQPASFRRPTPHDYRAPVMVKLGVPMDCRLHGLPLCVPTVCLMDCLATNLLVFAGQPRTTTVLLLW
jgi:hypothetical protein